jgi:uncharacterized membrane protein
MTRHRRFLIAFAFGLAVALLARLTPLSEQVRALCGVAAFFVLYLALMAQLAGQMTPATLRRRAAATDEGVGLIVTLAIGAVGISVTSIILVLNGPGGGSLLERVLALGSVPLGWAMLHTLAGFHYAHLYYRPDEDGEGGLVFPATPEPDAWDFLYFAFGIGMTAQVSDVTATSRPMRHTILFHAIGAFFYNTVILALAVNAAITAHS